MKSTLIIACLGIIAGNAFGFSSNNLVVTRVGDGLGTTGNVRLAVEEYTKTGTFVSSLGLLNLPGGRNLTSSFGETSEGSLTLSGDQQYLMISGYDLPLRDGGFGPTMSPRAVARINPAFNSISVSPQVFPASGDGLRAVYSPDGNTYYGVGGDMGIVKGNFAGDSLNQLLDPIRSSRAISQVGNELYFTGSNANNGANGVAKLNLSGNVYTGLFNTPIGSCRDLQLTNANTMYVSGASGIAKMTNSGGVWSLAYSLTGQSVGHFVVDSNLDIYAIDNNGTLLLKGKDNGTGFDAWTTLATNSIVDTRFRGIEIFPRRITGKVVLSNFLVSSLNQPVVFELRSNTNVHLDTKTALLDSAGNYALSISAPAGTYKLRAKGTHWLAKQNNAVAVGASGASNINFTLVNGDVDGDNEVGSTDFDAVVAEFGNPGVNEDLDGDGEVGSPDFDIVVMNYSLSGD